MSEPRKPPHSARVLSTWVDAYARDRGLAPKRVRDWISYMVIGGRLEEVSSSSAGTRFTIKGAVALEMRLPERARATKDIDLVIDGADEDDLAAVLREALREDYQDFSFRVKGEPYVMPNNAVQVEVAMDYRGRSWSTVQVDLSKREGEATEVELVDALELKPFGLSTPSALPCLSLRYHIAQKIHAMTQPAAEEDASNERFRDLADVLLLRQLVEHLPAVRAACVEVFAFRGTHGWPPALEPPAFWEGLYAELAAGLELEEKTLKDAVREARAFIEAIDATGAQ
ncbi:MAG: nucleotidyl transferase AbiEii/AbiGii toxin family protein [Longimicrobiales bacterium]